MEIDSYWRTRCVGEVMDQGLHVPPPDVRLREDHRLPVPPTPPPQRRQPGYLHRQHRFFVARSAEARRRSSGSIPRGTLPGTSNDDPVSRDPGGMERRGLKLSGIGAGGDGGVPPSPRAIPRPPQSSRLAPTPLHFRSRGSHIRLPNPSRNSYLNVGGHVLRTGVNRTWRPLVRSGKAT